MRPIAAVTVAVLAAVAGGGLAQSTWFPFPVEVWEPAFDMDSPRTVAEYRPLESAREKWRICVSFPHMKDAYWLAVNYGVADEARRLGIRMDLVQADGYEHLDTQIAQVLAAVAEGAQGVVIGAISYTGMDSLVGALAAREIPVVDAVNDMAAPGLSAKSLVSFGEMGEMAGAYIAARHPAGSAPAKVAWFPGPEAAGWVQVGDRGFREAVAGSAVEIVETRFGDTGKRVQAQLLAEVLERHPDIQYVAGTAPTAEAASQVLRRRGLRGKVQVVAYYFTPGVYRGIKRGTILAAPTDAPVIQGRIAVDQLVRILEGRDYLKHVGPRLQIIDGDNVGSFDLSSSLAPRGFRATYTVN